MIDLVFSLFVVCFCVAIPVICFKAIKSLIKYYFEEKNKYSK